MQQRIPINSCKPEDQNTRGKFLGLIILILLSENGFIEDEELDGFLREFVGSVSAEEDLEVWKYPLKNLIWLQYLELF